VPRIRTIKPEFWTDSKTGSLSDRGKVLFIGMLNHADDYGVLEYDAAALKAKIFPYHSGSATELVNPTLMDELLARNLVGMFTLQADGDLQVKRYLHVVNFEKHQVVNKPSKPLLEGWKRGDTPDSYGARFSESSVSTPVVVSEHSHPEVGSRKYEVGEGEQLPITAPTALKAEQQQQHSGETTTRGKESRRTRLELTELPGTWQLWAEENHGTAFAVAGTTPAAEFERFRNHHTSKGSLMADWPAAWRTWCGRAQEFGGARAASRRRSRWRSAISGGGELAAAGRSRGGVNVTSTVSRGTKRVRNRTRRVHGKAARMARAWRNARLIGAQTPLQVPTEIEREAVMAVPILDAQDRKRWRRRQRLLNEALVGQRATPDGVTGIDRSKASWWKTLAKAERES
jgi:hypothetical protein